MQSNPLLTLESMGQSIWMDFIRRGTISSGELAKWVNEDGVSGVTSNPSIFEKAIAGSHDYDESIRALSLSGKSADEIYQSLTVEDIGRAADVFAPVFDKTRGGDGFVSIEVSPLLAHDTKGTVDEARRLWKAVNRPNIYIKVPGTAEGVPAIRALISEGVNVNVTLLFGLPRYRDVADAYLSGLEDRVKRGLDISGVSSVASFFLSRIDTVTDKVFEARMGAGGHDAEEAGRVHGQVAIASAKIAYEIYKEVFGGERFGPLEAKGARRQRLLWASTSAKNPAYSDVKYVEALIGPETINTLPLETLNAYRDHGQPAPRLESGPEDSHRVLDRLPGLGINLADVTQKLEDEGVRKFIEAFDTLMKTVREKCEAALHEPVDSQSFALGSLEKYAKDTMSALQKKDFTRRLWEKDPSLWKEDQSDQKVIKNALGWLHVAEKMEDGLVADLREFVSEVRQAGFKHVVHMGMGGSSLAPMVFERSFSRPPEGIPLTVLDTTDPATILRIESEIPLKETLFIVASKSGTTAEPLAFGDYFYEKVKGLKGAWAGENFVAITDPSTRLVDVAFERKYRKTFLNFPDIGGRYSALSYFGLVPAALMGVDISELLARALRMAHACASCVQVDRNPGVSLGAALGQMARKGRDKVTFVIPGELSPLGMWLEQLIAESTGKEGTGILPVDSEPLLEPRSYGQDRVFVSVRQKGKDNADLDKRLNALKEAGFPVISVELPDMYDIGQEFFRWEIATATAGAVLGINAFDQPNVQESKDNTNRLLDEFRKSGKLAGPEAALTDGDVRVFGKVKGKTLAEAVKHFLSGTGRGKYVAFMAYLEENPETGAGIAAMRERIQKKFCAATTFGYGPRFLHSTGQFHKGGPDSGLFIQLTAADTNDAKIPGQPYSFSVLKRAQALGDFEALQKHDRKVLRIDLGRNVQEGLSKIRAAFEKALK